MLLYAQLSDRTLQLSIAPVRVVCNTSTAAVRQSLLFGLIAQLEACSGCLFFQHWPVHVILRCLNALLCFEAQSFAPLKGALRKLLRNPHHPKGGAQFGEGSIICNVLVTLARN